MNKMTSTIALLAMAGNVLMAGGDIAPVEPVVLEETVSDEWDFYASLNGWGPVIGIDTPKGTHMDINFNDILDTLKFTMMGTVGVQSGKWGILTDVVYLNLGKPTDFYIPSERSIAITNI